jgi:drug/metabolite transporter (DMT)-like permease
MVLIGPGALRHLGADTWSELAIVGAAVSYAFAGTYGRRFRAMPTVVPVAGMLTTSALMALPLALLLGRPWTAAPSVATWGALLGLSLLGLSLLSTALGFLIYFCLLSSAGATNVMLVTLLIPVTALLAGSRVLGEHVTGTALAGMALICCGLLAIDGRLLPRRLALKPRPTGAV